MHLYLSKFPAGLLHVPWLEVISMYYTVIRAYFQCMQVRNVT